MKKILLLIQICLLFCCSSLSLKKTITLKIKGSDTMLPLVRFWAEVYMIENTGVSVYVEGGGTATGMTALANGDVDICMASRTIFPEEAQRLVEKYGTIGVSTLVAKDALSIYVNPENPVKNLSIAQIREIYTGEIKNRLQVGGENEPIHLLNRMPTSGTFAYFHAHVLEGTPFTTLASALPTPKSIIETVAKDKNAIGFGGIAYEKNIYHCAINAVEPTEENVRNDSYPLTRYLYLYTIDNPQGVAKDFINWAIGEHGQDIVKWVGYFPIWQKK